MELASAILWRWLLFSSVEIAWLGAMWLLVPASRPWPQEADSQKKEDRTWRKWTRTVLLYSYVFYHLPALFVMMLFRIVVRGRVRPTGFLIIGGYTSLTYTLASVL